MLIVRIVRIVFERALLIVFALARSALIAQAVAMGLIVLLNMAFLNRSGSPTWLDSALSKGVLMAIVSLAAAIALIVAGRMDSLRRPPPEQFDFELPPDEITLDDLPSLTRPGPYASSESSLRPWIVPFLGFSLAALPALAILRSVELFDLWKDIWHLLDRFEIQKAFSGADEFSGVVLGPIFVALYVPGLEAAAAFFLTVVPLLLLALFLTRSHHFPRFLIMMTICQAGLVLTSALGAALFVQLVAEGTPALLAAGEPEGRTVVEALGRMQSVVASTATGFLPVLLGFCAWIPAMFHSRRVDAFFTAGSEAPLSAEPGSNS